MAQKERDPPRSSLDETTPVGSRASLESAPVALNWYATCGAEIAGSFQRSRELQEDTDSFEKESKPTSPELLKSVREERTEEFVYNDEDWIITSRPMVPFVKGLAGLDHSAYYIPVQVPWPTQHQSITEFHLFPKLVPEIRSAIWELALPAPRVLPVCIGKWYAWHFLKSSVEEIDAVYLDSTDCLPTEPPLRLTCKESRQVFFRNYQVLKCLDYFGPETCDQALLSELPHINDEHPAFVLRPNEYVSFRRDTILFREPTLLALEKKNGFLDLANLVHLALNYTEAEEEEAERILQITKTCPKLKALTLVLGKDVRRVHAESWHYHLLEIDNGFLDIQHFLNEEFHDDDVDSLVGDDHVDISPEIEDFNDLAETDKTTLWPMLHANLPGIQLKVSMMAYLDPSNEHPRELLCSVRVPLIPRAEKYYYSNVAYYTWRPYLREELSTLTLLDFISHHIKCSSDGRFMTHEYSGVSRIFEEVD
ncbi:hypothetical protein G7Y89_g1308 [Cudoniella acicularis]|uniref:2EXR domain-containing protein n=1 Tax=Cudoniella acicularis TaxID=354080 RepID=A0A8H4RYF4_9HELO|nr:hypothetical protein G7Y89_g1308 [Cudoniella acicularis]